nr:hypothetical protein [Tanacetum cinerariifolium]
MNYQPVTAGNQSNPSAGSKNPHNTDDVATFEVKEPEFEGKKPESEVHVSPSSSAKTKKHDDKTTKEAKGKSPIELSTGFRNLSEEFEIFLMTSLMSTAGPSNTAVSPTLEKSSYVDPSQYPDDPNMPALEDINYSDDEEEVDVEADFTNLETTITINNKDFHTCMFACFLSQEEPKRVHQAFKDPSWIEAMQEELLQFRMQKEEGIDYEEVFPPVAKIEAIRLFLAYASFMGFMALYGLHQAPRAWYETLANYLLENGFQRGKIDQTFFIKKQKGDILLVQVSVDDIIFGSTNKDLCKAFEKLIKEKFQMISLGEPTFFLGLQVKQKPDGIFISQDKYLAEILRKFGLTDGKSASTPIDTEKPLLKDPDGEDVDVHTDRSMIGSLMYLTSPRPDIMFAVCACAHF